jgi:preprotein translocase subunit SecG
MWVNILLGTVLTVFAIVCVLLILVVLMQRSKQDGLGAAFGSGITDSVFGAQTSTILTKFTAWLIAIFFVLSIGLSYLYGQRGRTVSAVQKELTAPVAVPAAVPPAPATTPTDVPAPQPKPVKP